MFQVTQTAIAKKFGCNQSTISDIFKKKNAIQSRKSDNGEKVLVSPKFPEIERVLAEWCTSCLSKGAVITGPLIRMQGKRVAEKLGVVGFTASSGWLDRFRK